MPVRVIAKARYFSIESMIEKVKTSICKNRFLSFGLKLYHRTSISEKVTEGDVGTRTDKP